MIKQYLSCLGDPDKLKDLIELINLGFTIEEIEGYFDLFYKDHENKPSDIKL